MCLNSPLMSFFFFISKRTGDRCEMGFCFPFCSRSCLCSFSCPGSCGRTWNGGERMHLIYKGDHSVHRPTRLSKHCTASRQRLAGRSSNHIFHLDTHSCANAQTPKHTCRLGCPQTSGVSTLDTPCLSFWKAKYGLQGKAVSLVGPPRGYFLLQQTLGAGHFASHNEGLLRVMVVIIFDHIPYI